MDRGKLLVVDLDPRDEVFCFCARVRHANADNLTDVANFVARNYRLHRRFETGQCRNRFDRLHIIEVVG